MVEVTGSKTGSEFFRNDRLQSVALPFDLTPGLVTVIYLALGFVALYFSDVYLPQIIQEPALLRREQALKGGVEVLLTAGLIFLLTRRSRLALQRYQGRLEHLQAERSVLHRVFRHNLRQELNLIDGHSMLIREEDKSGHFTDQCDVIEKAADRTEQYIEMTRQFERMLHSPAEFRSVDLVSMVANADEVNRLRESDDVELHLDLPEAAKVTGHSHVKPAFIEILENAVNHNHTTPKRVEVIVRAGPEGIVELSVSDNGPGVPKIERQTIERMEDLPLTHSGGLGLWFAKLACTVAGGDLLIRDNEMGGAEVVLQYPEAQRFPGSQQLASFWKPKLE